MVLPPEDFGHEDNDFVNVVRADLQDETSVFCQQLPPQCELLLQSV